MSESSKAPRERLQMRNVWSSADFPGRLSAMLPSFVTRLSQSMALVVVALVAMSSNYAIGARLHTCCVPSQLRIDRLGIDFPSDGLAEGLIEKGGSIRYTCPLLRLSPNRPSGRWVMTLEYPDGVSVGQAHLEVRAPTCQLTDLELVVISDGHESVFRRKGIKWAADTTSPKISVGRVSIRFAGSTAKHRLEVLARLAGEPVHAGDVIMSLLVSREGVESQAMTGIMCGTMGCKPFTYRQETNANVNRTRICTRCGSSHQVEDDGPCDPPIENHPR